MMRHAVRLRYIVKESCRMLQDHGLMIKKTCDTTEKMLFYMRENVILHLTELKKKEAKVTISLYPLAYLGELSKTF